LADFPILLVSKYLGMKGRIMSDGIEGLHLEGMKASYEGFGNHGFSSRKNPRP